MSDFFEALTAWLSEPPGRVDSSLRVDLATQQLTTQQAVAEGSLLLRVPEYRLLSPWKAANSPESCLISHVFQEVGLFPDDLAALATLLLHERALGSTSSYHPWLRTLPPTESTLVWSARELACLEGSPLIRLTALRQEQLRREYDHLFTALRRKFDSSLFPENNGFSFADYRWARLTAEARSLPLAFAAGQPARPALVPLLDFAPSDPLASWPRTVSPCSLDPLPPGNSPPTAAEHASEPHLPLSPLPWLRPSRSARRWRRARARAAGGRSCSRCTRAGRCSGHELVVCSAPMLSATTPLAKCGSKGSEWLLCAPQRRLSSSAARGGHSSTHRAAPKTRICHPAGRSRGARCWASRGASRSATGSRWSCGARRTWTTRTTASPSSCRPLKGRRRRSGCG